MNGNGEQLDPYLLANQVCADSTMPDAQKLEHLKEIGDHLGLSSVGQLARMVGQGVPLDVAIRSIHSQISTHREARKKMVANQREFDNDQARKVAEHAAEWGPKLAAQWQKYREAELRVKEAEKKFRDLESRS